MVVATATDVMVWIYELTKDEKVGKDAYKEEIEEFFAKNGKKPSVAHNPGNNNFHRVLYKPAAILVEGEEVALPVGTELAVFQKLVRYVNEESDLVSFGPSTGKILATIFLTHEQITVHMNGRIRRRRVY